MLLLTGGVFVSILAGFGFGLLLRPRAGDWYLVRAGLKEGEEVVVRGNFKIDSELQIRAKESMMSPGPSSVPETTEPPGLRAFSASLHPLLASINAVENATRREDLPSVHAAYGMLGHALQLAETGYLAAELKKRWEDLASDLALDIEEGKTAGNPSEARAAWRRLEKRREALKRAFGPFETVGDSRPGLPEPFRDSLAKLVDAYLKLGASLASDDAEGAAKWAKAAGKAFRTIEAEGLTAERKAVWEGLAAELKGAIEALGRPEIAELRKGFSLFSQALTRTLNELHIVRGLPIYRFRCPMAFDGSGATWLAEHRDVRNPYYGSTMYECGTLLETLSRPVAEPGGENHE